MDTTDPDIEFDEKGVCNHCHGYDRQVNQFVLEGEAGLHYSEGLVGKIRLEGKSKPYDCVIGVSGGVDSTFLAYKVKEMGLRPLAVHLDNGWDSELAVKNIEQTLNILGIDLHTHVLDWEEFKDLQLAFLKASTPDSEIPTDHAIAAVLNRTAERIGVRFVIIGTNVRTETHLPRAWSQGHNDWRYIASVYRRFGKGRLSSFPHQDMLTYLRRRLTIKTVPILNYLDYNKKDAMQILEKELGWNYYGGKHYESIYTRFYQGFILPVKFGYDKRRTHLSSLICSGEVGRTEALIEIEKPSYPPALQEEDRVYVIKKLGITDDEFEAILDLPKKTYWDYPSYGKMFTSSFMKRTLSGMQMFYRKINVGWRSGNL
jgi:N-acetyl sugar amidotransferase